MVADALVVAGEGHRRDGHPVGEGLRGDLAAGEGLLEDDGLSRLAEDGFFAHQLVDRVERFVGIVTDEGALAGGKAVRLDDDRPGVSLDVVSGVHAAGEDGAVGGGDAVAVDELLGERLRSLNLRCGLRGAERGDPRGLEPVDETEHERDFGSDDDEVDAVVLRRGDDAVEVGGSDVEVAGDGGCAGVAGGDEEVSEALRLAEFPCLRVFPRAGADDEDVHPFASGGR